MKNLKTYSKWATVFTIAALTLSACSSGGSAGSAQSSATNNTGKVTNADAGKKDPVTIKMWGWIGDQAPEKARYLDPAIAEFNAKNDYNAKIEYLPIPQDQYNNKITTEIAANNAPDIFMTHEAGFLAPFVKAGKVHALDDVIGKDVKDTFIPGIFDQLTFDGKTYAVPLVQTSQVVYYNKDIFAQNNLTVPKTMDDLMNIVKTLKSKNITPFALANKDSWTGGLFMTTLGYRYGGKDLFTNIANGSAKFTDDKFLKAATDFSQLVSAGAFNKDANSIAYDEGKQQFLSGKTAMWLMGSWEISSVTTKQQTNGTANPVYGKVDFFNWPAVNGGVTDANAWILAPDYNLAIGESSKNKEAAAAFIKLLVSKKYQSMLLDVSTLPATKVDIDKSKVDPIFVSLIDALGKANNSITFPDRILGQQTLGGEMNNATQDLVSGQDPKATVEKLEKRAAPMRTK